MNVRKKVEKTWEKEIKLKKKINTIQTAGAPVPVQHEDQRQTPWQGLEENHQRDYWFATCLAFADWCCNKTQRCRIRGN